MKLHPTDRLSLVFGVVFLVIALAWLLFSQLRIDLPTAGWFLAGGLILFGVLGLVGSLRPRRNGEPVSTPPASEDW